MKLSHMLENGEIVPLSLSLIDKKYAYPVYDSVCINIPAFSKISSDVVAMFEIFSLLNYCSGIIALTTEEIAFQIYLHPFKKTFDQMNSADLVASIPN